MSLPRKNPVVGYDEYDYLAQIERNYQLYRISERFAEYNQRKSRSRRMADF